MPFIWVFRKLLSCKVASFLGGVEPHEEKGIGRHGEEVVLRLLRVLVHWLTDGVECDKWIRKKFIVSVVPVGQDKEFKKFDEFDFRLLTRQAFEQAWELHLGKRDQWLINGLPGRLLLDSFTFLKVGHERQLEVLGHSAESRALKEEVKVLVIVPLTLLWPFRVSCWTDPHRWGACGIHGIRSAASSINLCWFFDSLALMQLFFAQFWLLWSWFNLLNYSLFLSSEPGCYATWALLLLGSCLLDDWATFSHQHWHVIEVMVVKALVRKLTIAVQRGVTEGVIECNVVLIILIFVAVFALTSIDCRIFLIPLFLGWWSRGCLWKLSRDGRDYLWQLLLQIWRVRLFVALEEDLLDWPLAVVVCSREKTFKLLLLLLNAAKVVAKVKAALPSAETELATCE